MEFENNARSRARISIAPLVDVVFLLLIFFLLTSTLVVTEAIDVELPSSATAARATQTTVVIDIERSGSVRIGDLRIDVSALATELRGRLRRERSHSVMVRADAAIPVETLVRVMDAVRSAGATSLGLATRPDQSRR